MIFLYQSCDKSRVARIVIKDWHVYISSEGYIDLVNTRTIKQFKRFTTELKSILASVKRRNVLVSCSDFCSCFQTWRETEETTRVTTWRQLTNFQNSQWWSEKTQALLWKYIYFKSANWYADLCRLLKHYVPGIKNYERDEIVVSLPKYSSK